MRKLRSLGFIGRHIDDCLASFNVMAQQLRLKEEDIVAVQWSWTGSTEDTERVEVTVLYWSN